MTRAPATVRPSISIAAAATVMARRRIRHLLVTDESDAGPLRGIVSLHDVARAFPPDVNPLSPAASSAGPSRRVDEIMSRNPVTVTPETALEDAARLMLERRFSALPVVHGNALAGIVTDTDLLRAFADVVGGGARAIGNASVRVTFDASDDEDAVMFVLDLARAHGMEVASVLTTWHEGRRLVVARVVGRAADALVDDVWRSGHRVLSVLRG